MDSLNRFQDKYLFNGTNGTQPYSDNLTIPLERTLITEYEPPTNHFNPNHMDLNRQKLQDIVTLCHTYASPLIFCTGIPLDIISIVIVHHGCIQKTSLAQYLYALLITDVTLLANLLLMWLTQRGFDLYKLGALCHFTSFLSHTSSFLSLWFTVCLAVDGYIRAVFAAHIRQLSTNMRARVVILCLVACAIAVYLNISLMVGVLKSGTQNICAPVNRYVQTLKLLAKIDIFINVILPYLALIYLFLHTSIILLIERIHLPRNLQRILNSKPHKTYSKPESEPVDTHPSLNSGNNSNKKKDTTAAGNCIDKANDVRKNIENICLCLVFFSLLLNLPSAVLRTYNTLYQLLHPKSPMVFTQYLWQQLFQYPYYMKSASNFLILSLASSDFRRILAHLPKNLYHYVLNKFNNGNSSNAEGRERVSIEVDPEDPDNS